MVTHETHFFSAPTLWEATVIHDDLKDSSTDCHAVWVAVARGTLQGAHTMYSYVDSW